MCLIVYGKGTPKIAEEDIRCYKVVLQIGSGVVITPCRHAVISDSILKGEENLNADGEAEIRHKILYDMISGGFIHTYKYETDAFRTYKHECCMIFECIIPKGTEYFSGFDGSSDEGYASKSIKFVRLKGKAKRKAG